MTMHEIHLILRSIYFESALYYLHSSIKMNISTTIATKNTMSMNPNIRPLYIFLDMFLISAIFLGCIFCVAFICISIGYRSCRSVLTLLSANSCVSGLVFNCVQFTNALLLFRDDIYIPTINQNQYCEIRSYLMHVSGSLLYYSYCIQSISRLFFVVFYKHTFLLTYHIHFLLIAIQWMLGFLLPISILTSDHRQYQTETSQCFITIKNISQTLYGMIKDDRRISLIFF